MSDIKLNSEGDLLIQNGEIFLTQTIQEDTVQRLSIKLKTYQSEWYLDLSEGIPYFQTILKKGTTKDIVDSIFRSAILEDEQIERIIKFESSISNSLYRLNFTALSNSGDLINLTESIQI